MKLRITQKQLDELNPEQKQNLCDLWLPNLYDVAVATVCVDAAEEKYGLITYVIGGITISKNGGLLLYDLKFLPDEKVKIISEEEASEVLASETADENEKDENNDTDENIEEEFSFDEDFSFEFQRPDSYTKQECLPLLDIGQMIDILARKNFGQCNFSLSVAVDDESFEISKDNFIIEDTYAENSEGIELCEILWKAVKALL
ncbi:hypothetical protein LY28_01111 [Ruminiclostridium sufflavum DSM 19573]|uniref:Uncharacterized protein n=1 Tax=Ruminiclostridium sufflavum DSM 19573 TaxID=1121337 RepID=A0A318XRJ9_9FIRM|nr:hypothetical protein [Ruminiclostridium sufflavum]PYG88756.1 hypothetical protein LY28_01111 [Ruminiclostridium sufflavum DSM 19573]